MGARVVLFGLLTSGLAAIAIVACGNNEFTGDAGDSGTDADRSDVVALDGAASDASAETGPPMFASCTQIVPAPYFCADFDEAAYVNAYQNGTLGTLFTANVVTDGGMLGSTAGGESLPNVLSSFVPALASNVAGTAAAIAPLTATGLRQHYRLDLDFRIEDLGSTAAGSAISLFSLKLYYSGGPEIIYYRIAVEDSQLDLGIGSASFSN
ncbi:MAG: hypothetical protein ACREJX_21265, partial [Polyangiaceae bacterium]